MKLLIFLLCCSLWMPLVSNGTNDNGQFHTSLVEHPKQCREYLHISPELMKAASYRAKHMADNDYFDHTDPFTGETPNQVVTRMGFVMHESYSLIGNNGESIVAGEIGLKRAFDELIKSPEHVVHLLGLNSFFCQQTFFGIGWVYNQHSHYKFYYVVLIYRGNT